MNTSKQKRSEFILLYGNYAIGIDQRGTVWHLEVSNPLTGAEVTTETDTLADAVALALMIAAELQDEWEGS